MLSNFPLCLKGWLDVFENHFSLEDLKSYGNNDAINWTSKFCLLMESHSKLYMFNNESRSDIVPIPDEMVQCRLDKELNWLNIDDNCCSIEDDAKKSLYCSSTPTWSINKGNDIKSSSRNGFFRNGSHFFRKFSKNKNVQSANYQPLKVASDLKRTASLNRINRKKSDDKTDYIRNKKNMCSLSQSTGDLTLDSDSLSFLCLTLSNKTHISEVHSSLMGERPHCFSISGFIEEINECSKFNKRRSTTFTTKYFCAKSYLEKQCWIKRLNQTLKPNGENENRINNSIKLTIFESKYLSTPKRKYYCDVSLDDITCAKTSTKYSSKDGKLFWADDININNLSNFKTLKISLYKECEPGKDQKRKKKKQADQILGQLIFTVKTLNMKNEIQSWFNLSSADIPLERSSICPIQLRVKIRYQSLKVLNIDNYSRLLEIASKHYCELIKFLEKNISIKLKEEIAVCLVNIHEKNGTIIQFLTDIISEEINDLNNSSMVLRSNTIVTKIIENHLKLVGDQYIHNILDNTVQEILTNRVSIEVDPSRYSTVDDRNNMVTESQKILIGYLQNIVLKIFESRNYIFPKQLKEVFIQWRKKFISKYSASVAIDEIDTFCDMIISGCMFLRLICPAILSPHLFSLVPHYSDEAPVQRTLTLIAKSLQSLANFSKFGEKEHYMIFLNSCFEEEIPRIHEFLRDISTKNYCKNDDLVVEDVNAEIHYYGACIDLPVELARLHNALACEEIKENVDFLQKFPNVNKLPEIIRHISNRLSKFDKTISVHPIPQLPNLPQISRREFGKISNDKSRHLFKRQISQNSMSDTTSKNSLHIENELLERSLNSVPLEYYKQDTNQSGRYYDNVVYAVPKFSQPQHLEKKSFKLNLSEIKQSRSELYPLKQQSRDINTSENHVKSHLPKNNESRKDLILTNGLHIETYETKKQDVDLFQVFSNFQKDVDSHDRQFYAGNPLYDILNIDNDIPPSASINDNGSKLDRYFFVRDKVTVSEQTKLTVNDYKDEHLENLCHEMKDIGMKLQCEQLKELKELKDILNFNKVNDESNDYSIKRPSKTKNNTSDICDEKIIETTDIFDDVIKAITVGGNDLVETQENLRRYVKKSGLVGKLKRVQEVPNIKSINSGQEFQSDISKHLLDYINTSDTSNCPQSPSNPH